MAELEPSSPSLSDDSLLLDPWRIAPAPVALAGCAVSNIAVGLHCVCLGIRQVHGMTLTFSRQSDAMKASILDRGRGGERFP